MFLGPLKPLRLDPPVIYLVLRPWQNFVGIEAGLLLGGFLLLTGFSGWQGGRWALLGLPVCLVMVVVGIVRLFYRHRIRIDRHGVYREQFTPGSRLKEDRPAAEVTAVHVQPVPVTRRWRAPRWRTGVALTLRDGTVWPLTAGNWPWRERRLARSVATVLGVPFWDRTIVGSEPVDAQDTRTTVGYAPGTDSPPPADPGLLVLDSVPRRFVVVHRSGRGHACLTLGSLLFFGTVAVCLSYGATLPVEMAMGSGLALLASGADGLRHRQELVLTMARLTIYRRGWWWAFPVVLPWDAITVLGRDAAQGGLLVSSPHLQARIGAGLSPQAVDWLGDRLRSYLP